MAVDDSNEFPDRILRLDEVVKMIGLSEATVWRETKAGRFPAPIAISPRRRGWRMSVLLAWLETRPPASPP